MVVNGRWPTWRFAAVTPVVPLAAASSGVQLATFSTLSRTSGDGRSGLEPAGDKPLLPSAKVLDNVQKVAGWTPAKGTIGVTAKNGQVGNLRLTTAQEA